MRKLFLIPLCMIGLTGCNFSQAIPVTAAICTDVVMLQQSSVALNKNQALAVQGIVNGCNATSGGTVFTNATAAVAIINDAILLQASGLLSDIHITAQAPDAQLTLRKIKLHWERYLK